MKTKRQKITEGRISTTLLGMALPMVVGILGMAAFNLVDTYFVGQLGKTELAAMSFTFPVVMLTGSVAMGVAVGTSAVLARLIGAEQHEKVRRITTDALLLAWVLVAITLVMLGVGFEQIFRMLGATEKIMPLVREYTYTWMWGVGFLVVPMVGNNAIRATGDTLTPGLIMLLSMTVNIVLDPVMIFGWGGVPALGLKGAALATVIARSVSFLVAGWIIFVHKKIGAWVWPRWQEWVGSVRQVMKIGLPAIGSQVVVPMGQGILIGIAAGFGEAAVAAVGVGVRIEIFAFAFIFAIGAALGPMVGQNWGAKKYQRIRQAAVQGILFSTVWAAVFWLFMTPNAMTVAGLFGEEADLVEKTAKFFQILPVGYLFFGLIVVTGSVLNVLHRSVQSAVLSLVHMFGCIVPGAYWGAQVAGYEGMLWGMVVGMTAAAVLAGALLKFYTTDERTAH